MMELKMQKIWVLSIILWISSGTKGDTYFGDPPFLPGDPDDRVTFGAYSPDSGMQRLIMQENIDQPIVVAYLNYSRSTPVPSVAFSDGTNATMGLVVAQKSSGGNWALTVTKSLDYDISSSYKFTVSIDGDEDKIVSIAIQMVVCKPPSVIPDQSSCSFKEFHTGETNCTFTVNDPRGPVDNLTLILTTNDPKFDEYFSFDSVKSYDQLTTTVTVSVVQDLNVDESSSHILNLKAINLKAMEASSLMVLEVQNIPMRPPKWITIPNTLTNNEKTPMSFNVAATDGDIQINTEINYKVFSAEKSEDFYHIQDPTVGTIDIDPIDRDLLQKEMFHFTVQAYKANNESSYVNQDIVLTINDINDHAPVVTPNNQTLDMREEKVQILSFPEPIFISDVDLADNAEYTVTLQDHVGDNDWYKNFALIPDSGYQNATFTLSIINAPQLDYELPPYQNMILEIVATEKYNKSHVGVGLLYINLINWNDELPKLESQQVTFLEDIGEGTVIAAMNGSDRDIGDGIRYSIIGDSALRAFAIDPETGIVTTKLPKSLDYETQTQVIVTVEITDIWVDEYNTPLHTTQAQLTINVTDVNDKTPRLYLNSNNDISVVEHSKEGTELPISISAVDPDTTAFLNFSIDWNNCRAMKLGHSVPLEEFQGVFSIETKFNGSNGNAIGVLKVETVGDDTVNYNKYELLYIEINVTDLNQEINKGYDTAVIAITIIDQNDFAPVFDSKITPTPKIVLDKANNYTLIGSVLATDADGPEYNFVTYSLLEDDEAFSNLVSIDEISGELRVIGYIDCDEPNYWEELTYTIVATDCFTENGTDLEPNCFHTPYNLSISITDVNDRVPFVESLSNGTTISIYERSPSDTFVNAIVSHDKDRDEPYHTVSYSMDAKSLGYFDVSSDGIVTVQLYGDNYLDRDFGQKVFTLTITLKDNINGSKSQVNTTSFTVILLDINNEIPSYDKPENFDLGSISENSAAGTKISDIHAIDYDDPQTPNAKVEYSIKAAWRTDIEDDTDYSYLFDVETNVNKFNGSIFTKENLTNYFGDYILLLSVHDWGEGELTSSQNFTLNIAKYNYEAPIITFPTTDLLLKQPTSIDDTLYYYGSQRTLERFSANDGFNGTKWDITLGILPDSMFYMDDNKGNSAILRIKSIPDQQSYQVTISAQDGDPLLTTTKTITISFADDNTVPVFDLPTTSVQFHEKQVGENHQLPSATCSIATLLNTTIKYFILEPDEHFSLVGTTNVLTVVKKLSVNEQGFYTLQIVATLADEIPLKPDKNSILEVQIQVLVVHTDPPVFDSSLFVNSITQNSDVNSVIFTLQAHNVDVNNTLSYALVPNTMQVSDSSLNSVKDNNPFLVKSSTGDVVLNFKVQSTMAGYFAFKVSVENIISKTDTADVNIYVIAEPDLVIFKFNNTADQVSAQQDKVAQIFTSELGYQCIIDKINPDADDQGRVIETAAAVTTHFLNDSKPVSGDYIRLRTSDIQVYADLHTEFSEIGLNYASAYVDPGSSTVDRMIQTILIVICCILFLTCMALLVFLVCRTRSLNKQINALSVPKFGSQASYLNRIGISAPNANQHAVEGSNPVWNADVKFDQFDNNSIGSGDSDLIGVEDNEAFQNYFNSVIQDDITKKSVNPMVNLPNKDFANPIFDKY